MKSNPARLDLRLDAEIKQLAARASALCGARSLSEFVIQAVREKAARVMEETEALRLSNQAFDAFWDACEAAPAPNAALQAAQRRRQMEQRINRTWVLTESALPTDQPNPILGYFTLIQGTVHRENLPDHITLSRFPNYPLPVIKLAWLGVSVDHQRSELRLGELLLLEALYTARHIVQLTGLGIAVVTDPLTEASGRFFCKYGFTRMNRIVGERDTLFLSLHKMMCLDPLPDGLLACVQTQ